MVCLKFQFFLCCKIKYVHIPYICLRDLSVSSNLIALVEVNIIPGRKGGTPKSLLIRSVNCRFWFKLGCSGWLNGAHVYMTKF